MQIQPVFTHMNTSIQHLMQTSGVGFGTSGVRGLVTQMTDEICFAYTLAFLQTINVATK